MRSKFAERRHPLQKQTNIKQPCLELLVRRMCEFHLHQPLTATRLAVFEGHAVTNLTANGRLFNLTFERDVAGTRASASQTYDVVILAIGFGIEPRFAIPQTDTASYWRDAGVPGVDIDGNPSCSPWAAGKLQASGQKCKQPLSVRMPSERRVRRTCH